MDKPIRVQLALGALGCLSFAVWYRIKSRARRRAARSVKSSKPAHHRAATVQRRLAMQRLERDSDDDEKENVPHRSPHGQSAPDEALTTEALRTVFRRFAGHDNGTLGFQDFKELCDVLQLDMPEVTLERIFRRITLKTGTTRLRFKQFLRAVRHWKFLANIVSTFIAVKDYKVPPTYDFTKSTNDNYKADHMEFYGPYAYTRQTRDYSWHVNYTQSRQHWQDQLLQAVVVRTEPQPRPWLIYTCGPMGAGKGHTLGWMSEQGFFPLEDIVHIDPDSFKHAMPEWESYVSKNMETAGSMCHRESGYLVELAQEEAMRLSQHVWVDGSLRDADWYSSVLDDVRSRFPQYRIAILYVWAPEKLIRERVSRRAEATGRAIPERLLKQSLSAPDRSLKVLTPKVDFVARILNGEGVPVLEAIETVDRSGAWAAIKQRIGSTVTRPDEFPRSIPPFFLRCANLNNNNFFAQGQTLESLPVSGDGKLLSVTVSVPEQDVIVEEEEQEEMVRSFLEDPPVRTTSVSSADSTPVGLSVDPASLPSPALSRSSSLGSSPPETTRSRSLSTGWRGASSAVMLRFILDKVGAVHLDWSHPHPVNLDSDARELAAIPHGAHQFVWSYPSKEVTPEVAEELALDITHPVVCLLVFGGFIYFDLDDRVVQVNALIIRHNSIRHRRKVNMLHFGPGVAMDLSVADTFGDRWHPVSIPHLFNRGACSFAWVLPGERIAGKPMCRFGGFLFMYRKQAPRTRYQVQRNPSTLSTATCPSSPLWSPLSGVSHHRRRKAVQFGTGRELGSVRALERQDSDTRSELSRADSMESRRTNSGRQLPAAEDVGDDQHSVVLFPVLPTS